MAGRRLVTVMEGRHLGTAHRAVGLVDLLPRDLVYVGGFALMAWLGALGRQHSHRATVDLDVLVRDPRHLASTLEALSVRDSGAGKFNLPGELDVDVIEVAPIDAWALERQLEAEGQLSDLELTILASTWTHDHSEEIDLVFIDEGSGQPTVRAHAIRLASPVGLATMKAIAARLRSSARPEKRASDIYDIGRILHELELSPAEVNCLPSSLRAALVGRLRQWFLDDQERDRTLRLLRRFDDPPLDMDKVAVIVERLIAQSSAD